jgi:putative hydrolase of HD superfamily
MKELVNFLIETNKLKEIPRRGLVVWRVKNPITIAEHTFRFIFSSWMFSLDKNFQIKKVIKIAFFHDLCEVYTGDLTPLFYYRRRSKKMMRWFRLSQREREKRAKKKFELEKNSLLKLIKDLNSNLKNEILYHWMNFTRFISPEAKFLKQIDRIETLLESLEYIGTNERITGKGWWEGTEEMIEDPLLLKFLKVIQKKFYGKTPKYKKNRKLENLLDFLLKIGKLRRMPRLYWLANGIKNPETVGEHIFSVTLTAWVLGKEKKSLNMEKMLKMALCHELSAVYTGDTIPYIRKLPKDKKKRKEILKKWPRLPAKEKVKRFIKEYNEEKKALLKLTKKLDPFLKKEIVALWEDYRKVKSPEALFLIQVNTLAVLLQGLLYQQKNRGYLTDPLWEWAFEKCTDPIALKFLEALKEKFY